ncbi:sigma-70 region 4 domain-containing protein [Kitasatospora viridis]|uniref:Uncharacterized protein n=1 Tax=Kitasatospora viridis TaxID=281105 RepID=A0A561SA79_9ACTN|nr:sigma-70 region 4 domain-containing protein [Kitasatospora viridis]TWF71780.1 hypothetical protein FHX73_18151 [Kitasatospora viridis]
MPISVTVLREMFRNLQSWRSLYEVGGPDVITGLDGQDYCIHDITHLYTASQATRANAKGQREPVLSPRQAQAIRMFLFENMLEKDVARRMGVSETNPVASYATQGLIRLLALAEQGQLALAPAGPAARAA